MIDNFANGIVSTCSRGARIDAFLVNASFILRTFGTNYTFRSTVWWHANIARLAWAHRMLIDFTANTVGTTHIWRAYLYYWWFSFYNGRELDFFVCYLQAARNNKLFLQLLGLVYICTTFLSSNNSIVDYFDRRIPVLWFEHFFVVVGWNREFLRFNGPNKSNRLNQSTAFPCRNNGWFIEMMNSENEFDSFETYGFQFDYKRSLDYR